MAQVEIEVGEQEAALDVDAACPIERACELGRLFVGRSESHASCGMNVSSSVYEKCRVPVSRR